MPDNKEYRQTAYNNLKEAYGGNFNKSFDQFSSELDSNPTYSQTVHDNLSQAYGKNFQRSIEDFDEKLGLKKKESPQDHSRSLEGPYSSISNGEKNGLDSLAIEGPTVIEEAPKPEEGAPIEPENQFGNIDVESMLAMPSESTTAVQIEAEKKKEVSLGFVRSQEEFDQGQFNDAKARVDRVKEESSSKDIPVNDIIHQDDDTKAKMYMGERENYMSKYNLLKEIADLDQMKGESDPITANILEENIVRKKSEIEAIDSEILGDTVQERKDLGLMVKKVESDLLKAQGKDQIEKLQTRRKDLKNRIASLKGMTEKVFSTNPEELAKSTAIQLKDESPSLILKYGKKFRDAIPKDIPAQDQFNMYYDIIHQRFQNRAMELGWIDKDSNETLDEFDLTKLTIKNMTGNLNGRETLAMEEMSLLKTLAPIYFFNQSPISGEDSFIDTFWKGFMQEFYGEEIIKAGTGGTTPQQQSEQVIRAFEDIGITPEEASTDFANVVSETVEVKDWSGEDWGNMMAATAGIGAKIASTSWVPGSAFKSVNNLFKLEKVARADKLTGAALSYAEKLSRTRLGKLVTVGAKEGVKFETAGTILNDEEELTFLGGFLGASAGKVVEKGLQKTMTLPVINKLFGGKTKDFVEITNKFVSRGLGETAEEFTQEVYQIYDNSGNLELAMDEVSKMFEGEEFTDTGAFKLFVQSFIMGVGMRSAGATSEIVDLFSKDSKKAYDALSEEDQAKADQVVKEFQDSSTEALTEVDKEVEQDEDVPAVVEEETELVVEGNAVVEVKKSSPKDSGSEAEVEPQEKTVKTRKGSFQTSRSAKEKLSQGVGKLEQQSDGSFTEVEFTKDDADLELDRLEILASKGKLTEQEFLSSYFGQSTSSTELITAKKELSEDPVKFIAEIKSSFISDPEVTEGKFTTSEGKYTVDKSPGGVIVTNVSTGKEVGKTSKNYKGVVEEYKQSILPTVNEGATAAEKVPGVTEPEYRKAVAQESENPAEIAETYLAEINTEQEVVEDSKDSIIEAHISAIPQSSWNEFDDANSLEGIRQAKINYNIGKEGESLDVQAQVMSDALGTEVTPLDIIEFVKRYPGGKQTFIKEGKTARALKERFLEVTGVELDEEYAMQVAGVTKEQVAEIDKFPDIVDQIIDGPVTVDNVNALIDQHNEGNLQHIDIKELKEILNILENEGTVEVKEPSTPSPTKTEGTQEKKEAKPAEPKEVKKETEGEPKANEPDATPKDLEADIEHNLKSGTTKKAMFNIGLNTTFIADIPKKFMDKMPSAIKEYFTSKGLMPHSSFNEVVKMNGKINSLMFKMTVTTNAFKKAMKKVYGGKETEFDIKRINDVLAGKGDASKLHKSIVDIVGVMRAEVDALSTLLINDGIVEGKTVATIQDNLGRYLTRSYRVHEDPKSWVDYIENTLDGQAIRNEAVAFLRSEYAKIDKTMTDGDIDGVINELLFNPDAPMGLLSGSKVGSKDLSILKKRKNIAAPIRALMGEHTDPLLNYTRSVTKMAHLIEKSKFLHKVKAVGLDKYLFKTPNKKHFAKIASDKSTVMNPLNGLYTTPEILQAFETFDENSAISDMWLRTYMKVNGFVKYSKTILSLMTHIRNILGNLGFLVMNGHINFLLMPDAVKTVFSSLSLNKSEFTDKFARYLELGVVYDNANAGELRATLQDATGQMDNVESLFDGVIVKAKRNFTKWVNKAYQAEDDVFKIFAFENELARYKKALPELPIRELEERVAEIIRNVYPTYSLVPKIIKAIRKVPLFGTFVAFPAEVIRTTINTAELAAKELRDPNKEIRKIGAQRTAGIMTAMLASTSVMMGTRALLGIDEEEDEMLRRFLPDWSKNSQLLFIEKGNGHYKYIDMSGSDPHAYLLKPVMALLSEGEMTDNTIESMMEVFQPFLGEEIFARKLREVKSNIDGNGRPIYNPQLPAGDRAHAIAEHVLNALEPGTLTSFRRIWKGIHGTKNTYGKQYDPVDEVIALFSGMRITDQGVAQSHWFKTLGTGKDITEARQIYIKNRRSTVPLVEQDEAFDKANEAKKRVIEEAHLDYKAALGLGVSIAKLDSNFTSIRISGADEDMIKSGVYVPLDR